MNPIPIYRLESINTSRVYNSGKWIDGKNIKTLEEKLKDYLQVRYVILTNSGTSALLAAYWGLKNDAKELTVDPYTFPATYQPAAILGYRVNFFRSVLKPDLKFPGSSLYTLVHLYGQPNRLINQIPKQILIEDACQAFGAEINGKKVGAIGRAGCFSFYPTKSLHTCGHGGAVVTNDRDLYKKMKVFVESGRINGEITPAAGLNLRMDEIKAEFLIQEIADYEKRLTLQRSIAREYLGVIPPPQPFLSEKSGDRHIYSVFNLLVEERNGFRKFMAKKGIETVIYYGKEVLPGNVRPTYRDITSRIAAIPCRWNLTWREVNKIKTALKDWFSR